MACREIISVYGREFDEELRYTTVLTGDSLYCD